MHGLNLHVAATDALLRRFAFIPYARLDDILVSYATDGGGVGPHFDSYDVFEMVAHGSGMRLDPRTLLLFDAARMYVNGEAVALPVPQRSASRALADRRTLAPGATLPRALCSLLHRWYLHGWLLIGERHG